MVPVFVIVALLLAPADRMTSETRAGVKLRSDLGDDDRDQVFAIVNDSVYQAEDLLKQLGVQRKNSKSARLRIFNRESDYDDWRRRTNDQSTVVSSLSFYDVRNHEIVAAWSNGSDEAQQQLRRQAARHVLLQYATDPANWIEEGFAGYFEGLAADPYGDLMDGVSDKFLEDARRAIYAETYCPLFELMDLPDIEFYGLAGARQSPWSRNTLYAQSWSLLFFLLESDAQEAKDFLSMTATRLDSGRWDQRKTREALERLEPQWREFIEEEDLQQFGRLMRAAWSDLERGRAGDARTKAEEALEQDGEHRSARRVLARAALLEGDLDTAADAYSRLLDQRDDDYDARLALANVYLERVHANPQDAGSIDLAVSNGRRAAELAPPGRRHEGLVIAADAAELSGDIELALTLVREVTRTRGVPSEVSTAMKRREQDLVKRAIGR